MSDWKRLLQYQMAKGKIYDPVGEALEAAEKQRQEKREWPHDKFIRQAERKFDHYYGDLLTYRKQVVIDLYRMWDLEEDKRAKHIVLLRGIFVFPEFRGNGLARFVIRTTTTIAENTGACVCAVCNPYSVAVSDDPETRTRWMYESFLFDYEDDYLEHQKSMRKRFSESGFQNWDISENIGNKERCTPEDCFIFIPSSADREFTNSIQYRIL